MPLTTDIYLDFCESLKAKLSGLRLKHPGTVRIIPQSNIIELEISFSGTGAGQRTKCFSVSKHVIEDHYARGVWKFLVEQTYEMIERDLLQNDLCATPRTSPAGARLRYRVVQRVSLVTNPAGGFGVTIRPPEETTLWEGDDPKTCQRKLGRIDGVDLNDGTHQRTDNILQKHVGNSWVDIPMPSRAVDRANPIKVPDALAAVKQALATQDPPGLTATQVKRQRQMQASARRSGNFAAPSASNKPIMPELQRMLRGPGDPNDYGWKRDDAAVRAEEARKRAEEEERQRRAREEAERRRKEEEERKRRERIERIKETARQPWTRAGVLQSSCVAAWEAAALHEAEARGKQVEADLFGGGLDDELDAGEKWVEAEEAARALLEFARDRLEEAQARRAGKGFESVYDEEEIPEEELAQLAMDGVQEHVDEGEFEQVARQHVVAQLQREAEEEEPPLSEPPTGDEAMDQLMGMGTPGLVTKPAV